MFGNLHCPDVLVQAIVRNTRFVTVTCITSQAKCVSVKTYSIHSCRSRQHNGYIHSAGSELARAAIAQHFGNVSAPLRTDDIIITSGCSGAIEIALQGLVNPGDNVLLPKPGFPLYQALCQAHKIECRFYNLLVSCHQLHRVVCTD